jgi:hypothetical protein
VRAACSSKLRVTVRSTGLAAFKRNIPRKSMM